MPIAVHGSYKHLSMLMAILLALVGGLLLLLSCTPTPPDKRAAVTLPPYTVGDSRRGAELYEEQCAQCHKLKPGSNHKGPQLLGIYGAPAAALADYKYSPDMTRSNWRWDAKTLDSYITDPVAVMPDTRMLSDPMPNQSERQDIIAYLSTLGRADTAVGQPHQK